MSSMFELTDEFVELYQSEDFDEKKLEETAIAIKGKAEGAALFLKSLESDSKQIATTIMELQAKKKAIDNKFASFRGYVKFNLEKMGLERLEAGVFTFTINKNGGKLPVLIVLPPEKIDKRYQKINIDIDKEAILADFEETGIVPNGIEISERGTHLRIK